MHSFKLDSLYLASLILSNVGKLIFPLILKACIWVLKQKTKFVFMSVHVLHKISHSLRKFSIVVVLFMLKNCTKKGWRIFFDILIVVVVMVVWSPCFLSRNLVNFKRHFLVVWHQVEWWQGFLHRLQILIWSKLERQGSLLLESSWIR